jgi:hypothetical protein
LFIGALSVHFGIFGTPPERSGTACTDTRAEHCRAPARLTAGALSSSAFKQAVLRRAISWTKFLLSENCNTCNSSDNLQFGMAAPCSRSCTTCQASYLNALPKLSLCILSGPARVQRFRVVAQTRSRTAAPAIDVLVRRIWRSATQRMTSCFAPPKKTRHGDRVVLKLAAKELLRRVPQSK